MEQVDVWNKMGILSVHRRLFLDLFVELLADNWIGFQEIKGVVECA